MLIFTFGDPLSIVLSVIRKSKEPVWGPAHFKNMNADWSKRHAILEEDVLGLEKMFDAFYQQQSCDSMCLRYETLWENENCISDFLNTQFKLPEKKNREAESMKDLLTSEQKINFQKGYRSLIEKIQKADDCKIWKRS